MPMPTRICASVWTTKRASSSLKAGDVSLTPRIKAPQVVAEHRT